MLWLQRIIVFWIWIKSQTNSKRNWFTTFFLQEGRCQKARLTSFAIGEQSMAMARLQTLVQYDILPQRHAARMYGLPLSMPVRFGCVDIFGTSWDQCRSMVQYCFTSTETVSLVKPVLNWANVCSPNILRTVQRTMIRFLIELLVRRTWFGQSKLYFVLNWLVMWCKLRPKLAADAQQTAWSKM